MSKIFNKSFFAVDLSLFLLLTLAMLVYNSCTRNNTSEPLESVINVNEDVAESVAGSIGEQSGGAMDQLGDLMTLASVDNFNSLPKLNVIDSYDSISHQYDPDSVRWIVTIKRQRQGQIRNYYGYIYRELSIQYLKDDIPQQFRVVGTDTANTLKLRVLAAEGRHRTWRISQKLKDLESGWTATGINSDTVVINGYYNRAAEDTIRTYRATRTHDHNLELNISDVKGPRGSRLDLSQKISGIISGLYHADITFTTGRAYRERSVDVTIYIVLNNGKAIINVDGDTFQSDLLTGELETAGE